MCCVISLYKLKKKCVSKFLLFKPETVVFRFKLTYFKLTLVTFQVFKFIKRNKVENINNEEAEVYMAKFGLTNNGHANGQNSGNNGEDGQDSKKQWNLKRFFKEWVWDTNGDPYYYWLGIISCAFAYNLICVIGNHSQYFFNWTVNRFTAFDQLGNYCRPYDSKYILNCLQKKFK